MDPLSAGASNSGQTNSPTTTFHFNNFPDSPGDPDKDDIEERAENKASIESPSFWSFAYYQRFFDIDTDIVLSRVINSMVPRFRSNFILNHIRPSPDLYGPWWISVSLIFTISIASNLEGYFALASEHVDYHWSLEFGVVTAAAAAIFAYVWFVPLILYGFFWWRKSQESFSFTEIICAYGYSLAIYVPISLLWVIPYSWFQWTLIAFGLVSSGLVLVIALWPAVRHEQRLMAVAIMVSVIALHALLAIGFKMVFFHAVSGSRSLPNTTTVGVPFATGGITKAAAVSKGNSSVL